MKWAKMTFLPASGMRPDGKRNGQKSFVSAPSSLRLKMKKQTGIQPRLKNKAYLSGLESNLHGQILAKVQVPLWL